MKRKTHKIVFASVLKPCTDLRMYEKLAASIASSFDGSIYMLGHKSALHNPNNGKFIFREIFTFHRTAWARLFTEYIFLYHLLTIKPQRVVVTTYELLASSILYKCFTGAKVYYDVQENYALNIKTGTLLPAFKFLLAGYVRLKERMLAPFVDAFLLAEACYKEELPYTKKRATVIGNKAYRSILQHQRDKSARLHICITGTLGKTYGTLPAIEALKGIHAIYPEFEATIIGYCADQHYLEQIKKSIYGQQFMQLIGGHTIINHEEIIEVIAKSHVSLMYYEINKSFINKIPTKFYECTALNTQIVTTPNKVWAQFLSTYNAGICITQDISHQQLLHTLLQLKNKPCRIDDHLFFDLEKIKLQNVLLNAYK